MRSRFRQALVLAGVLVLGVAVIAVGLRMYPLSAGDAPADGRIAFVSDRDGDDEIYVMNPDGSEVEQLTDNESTDSSPSWSSDGKRIAFLSGRGNDYESYDIYVMNADGSGVEQVTDGCSVQYPAWSPDGDRIAYVSLSNGDIYVVNADGSDVEQLTGDVSSSCKEVYWADADGNGSTEAYIVNADGSVEILPEESWFSLDHWSGTDWFPAWSPDGGRIAFISGRDGDGSAGDVEIYTMNADGTGVERLTETEYWNSDPAWSPDGGRIAFSSGDGIYVMNAGGGGLEQLTVENDYHDFGPEWSPDGERIAFFSSRDGDVGIYVMSADGSGVERLADGYDPAWSPAVD